MGKVLIIDDNINTCKLLSGLVHQLGYDAVYKHTIGTGIKEILSNPYEVVLLDVHLPDGNGLDIIPKFRKIPSSPEVIILTGFGNGDGAKRAIENGAWDYIEKPISMSELKLQLVRALQYRQEKGFGKTLVTLKRDDLIGNSSRINVCLDLVAQSASSRTNVFITGETGTGKELFARAIHANSACSGKNFVVVDCAALPEQLTESMLFGHVKGAFTGADKSQEGLIRLADEGTLFLDEVGELSLSIQKRFLRVLQEKRFRPVGSSKETESDFRLISATNRNLDKMVQEGRFRQDLLFRLRTFSIDLPPLRDRKEDIKGLILHHISNLCKYHGQETKGFVPEFLEVLEMYDWPGNVRELVNTLEKSILTASTSPVLYPVHLPDVLRLKYFKSFKAKNLPEPKQKAHDFPQDSLLLMPFESLPDLKTYRERLIEKGESEYIRQLMIEAQNDISRACKISGLGKSRLYTLIKKYNISRDKK